ncbi:MAG: peptide chain release factor N(5)-glutamine methyltransferase [Acidobacteria bacterium]|nr:peptide chain release factor N(5)-glutamine methyltransferase [Acidobacteriota bacterium]
MRVFEALATACEELTRHAVVNSRVDAEILLAQSLGKTRSALLAHNRDDLDESSLQAFFAGVRERCRGKPLQYIVGQQEFRGLLFEVSPSVFIPRPETEFVVEAALEHLEDGDLKLADVGTGSGCLAVSLAVAFPRARIWATDLSEAALEVARRNAARHGVGRKIAFLQGDLLKPLIPRLGEGQLDAVVSNPPYVGAEELSGLQKEVRDWEPRLALVGEEGAASLYARLLSQAHVRLRPAGVLIMEIGYSMQEAVCGLLGRGWDLLGVTDDLNGIPRVVSARRV